MWAPQQIWAQWRGEKLPVPVGNRTLIVHPVAYSLDQSSNKRSIQFAIFCVVK